ncbi:hypothetical protein BDM02DRAFT_1531878 [Thelephora ganbajun]|uniref:Uncharacterized protein n=1 Tax=Thelephora ganbajun TaxID=370292 RepID=A0ACB6ZKH9_THEGA|nr:hypothetical protein BDM02DRAFT_1531878 [Thelephora ganbajun]
MSRNGYTLGLISRVRDQALVLSRHPAPWPRDAVNALYKALQACTLATRLDISNALPVNRLPHEVLSHVFELACLPPSATTMAFKAALTRVCSYWRGVLLCYPKIWTDIFVRRDTSDFLSECLLRSRALPIHLNFHYHMGWDSPSGCSCNHPSLVSRHVRCPHIRARKATELFGGCGPRGRLRSLDLLFFSDLTTTGFDELEQNSFFNGPLPELESLRLVCLDTAQAREEFIIHDGIFPGSLPKLKRLSLVHCWGGLISWVVGLTSFHLEFRHSREIQSVEFAAFLKNSNGTLEVLSLDNIGFSGSYGEPATLANLKGLKLKRVADPSGLFQHVTLPTFKNLTTLRVRFSDGIATFSATDDSGVVLQVIESQEDTFSYCTNGLAFYGWTQVSTLDLDLHGSRDVSASDVENLYHSIPSLDIMEIRTVSNLRNILLRLLPTKHVLHPSLKLLQLQVPRGAREEVFAALTTVTYRRKAMGCVLWDIECICDESCGKVSNQ